MISARLLRDRPLPIPSTYHDAIDCLRQYRLWTSVSRSIRVSFEAWIEGQLTETPKPGTRLFQKVHHEIIGNNQAALDAMISTCAGSGDANRPSPPLIEDARVSGSVYGFARTQHSDKTGTDAETVLPGGRRRDNGARQGEPAEAAARRNLR